MTSVPESIVVTGGAGFIGSHLVSSLAPRASSISVIDDLSTGVRTRLDESIRFHEVDIRDTDLVAERTEQAAMIIHLAADIDVSGSIRDPWTSHSVNVNGSLSVMNQARKNETPMIIASSAAVYGSPTTFPIDESHPTRPESPYGVGKLTVDHYARVYHDLYGLDISALRYFNVYGPVTPLTDESDVVNRFVSQAMNDEPITIHGEGDQTRDFVHVDDVVDATISAIHRAHSGTVYNIGSGTETTIRELAELICAVTDSRSDIVHERARAGDIDRSVADISRAAKHLDFEPSIGLREGIESLVERRNELRSGARDEQAINR